jgi:hypothetical protein
VTDDEKLVVGLLFLLVLGKSKPHFAPWSDEDMRAFVREMNGAGMNPEAALLVYYFESGLQPWNLNAAGSYGINQVQLPLLRASGFQGSPLSYLGLSVRDQLPFVGKVLRIQLSNLGYVPSTAAELMRVQLSPVAAKARADVIYADPSPGYKANHWLDKENKGKIVLSDLERSLETTSHQAAFQSALAQLRRVVG